MIIAEKTVLRASQWCYNGLWGIVTKWFRVPAEAPHITGADDQNTRSFRPAEGFLRYLKLFFWIGLLAIDGLLLLGWIILMFALPLAGLALAPVFLAIMILPDIVAFIAIHLKYDTTWYVLSDRSMRIRRGIWIIHETTITYDNIQNVSIHQGPVQRHFEIANVLVETAGGGSATGQGKGASLAGHHGLLEGISNADEVRNLILAKWKSSKSSGLGDETNASDRLTPAAGFSPSQVQILEQIRDLAIALE